MGMGVSTPLAGIGRVAPGSDIRSGTDSSAGIPICEGRAWNEPVALVGGEPPGIVTRNELVVEAKLPRLLAGILPPSAFFFARAR
jgi:hypothetical protein